MLLKHLFIRDREFTAENKVSECVFIKDVVAEDGVVVLLKINSMVVGPKPVDCPAIPMKLPKVSRGLLKPGVRKIRNEVYQFELFNLRKGIEKAHALLAEINLVHGFCGCGV